MFSLSQSSCAVKDKIIEQWKGKFDAQAVISDQWRRSYDQEHKLRLLAEGLVTNLEHQISVKGFWGKVGGFAVGAGIGLLAGRLLK
jgi:hypothetical protein